MSVPAVADRLLLADRISDLAAKLDGHSVSACSLRSAAHTLRQHNWRRRIVEAMLLRAIEHARGDWTLGECRAVLVALSQLRRSSRA